MNRQPAGGSARPKVVGIGLNKTGTKTLRSCLIHWGYAHQSYDLEAFRAFQDGRTEAVLDGMETYDSFEDWPWPLMYREIDRRFPDARFVLTTRASPDAWYASLCKMAVRIGPLVNFEQQIYGHAEPQKHRAGYLAFYERHNAAVRAHFRDRPGKLLTLCWETGDGWSELARFLGEETPDRPLPHVNRTLPMVYGGDNPLMIRLSRGLHVGVKAFYDFRRAVKRSTRKKT